MYPILRLLAIASWNRFESAVDQSWLTTQYGVSTSGIPCQTTSGKSSIR